MTTVEQGPSREAQTGTRRTRGLDILALGLGAILLRIPSLLASANLGYDDGGYGVAAIAMRQGYEPFRDIFSSQGPLFLPLVHLADLAGFETLNAPRLLAVLAGAVTSIAVYCAGRELMDRGRALLAGALTATSGILLWTTGPLTSDGTAAAISVSAVAVALVYRRRPSTAIAIAVAVLAGSAFSVKNLLVTPALLIAWVLVLSRRRILDAVLVPLGAFAVLVLASAPWGFTDVYRQSIQYHLDKTGEGNRGGNASKLVTTYWGRSTFVVALGVVGLATNVVNRLRGSRPRPPDHPISAHSGEGDLRESGLTGGSRILWWWTGLVLVVLLLQDPMFRNHLAALVAPLSLLVARYRPSWRVVAITAILTIPYQASQLHDLLVPGDYSGDAAIVVNHLRALPDGAWALSDEPGFIWRAGKGTDPFYVDPSVLRIHSRVKDIAITEDRLVHSAANPRQCAFVIWAPVRFGSFPDLPARLEQLGYQRVEDFGHRRGVWIKPNCHPQG